MKIPFRIFVLTFLFFVFIQPGQVFGQAANFFSENRYADYPVISLKENFLGNPVYFVGGDKIKASEVRAYMEIMPGDANDFMKNHTKAMTGTGLLLGGQVVVWGALGYAIANRDNLNNQIVRNWIIATTIGGIGAGAGRPMNRDGVRRINTLLNKHNYLIRQDDITKPYLSMDFRNNHLGEKIDIYDGPNLLTKSRLNQYMLEFPEFAEYMRKSQRNQNWSSALGIVGLASTVVFVGYILTPQIQSSTPSNILLPLTMANIGLSISGGIVRRAARNHTRQALMKFNFGDEFVSY
ncbi:hypothetical protein [Cecembia calidifontis]|jgi:hypothetical protein|uniref:Uncharacterized protein n=1 Tax=Cecembia calidifontis TaxID=1187080 RepID=A0A4Q7P938_9BACT|nr:hypothetical protein [Cecembia calidifontis]RZS96078.1 hypothetical protein BC751_1634 [Cecembia calidifontis]